MVCNIYENKLFNMCINSRLTSWIDRFKLYIESVLLSTIFLTLYYFFIITLFIAIN